MAAHRAALPIALPNVVAQLVLLAIAVPAHSRILEIIAYAVTAATIVGSFVFAQRAALDVERRQSN